MKFNILKMKSISIIIPTFNEIENIIPLVHKIKVSLNSRLPRFRTSAILLRTAINYSSIFPSRSILKQASPLETTGRCWRLLSSVPRRPRKSLRISSPPCAVFCFSPASYCSRCLCRSLTRISSSSSPKTVVFLLPRTTTAKMMTMSSSHRDLIMPHFFPHSY